MQLYNIPQGMAAWYAIVQHSQRCTQIFQSDDRNPALPSSRQTLSLDQANRHPKAH